VFTLLFLLGATALPAAAPADAETIALHFVRALASGGMDELAALSTVEATASPEWQLLRTQLETYDCISLPAHEVTVERATDDELTLLVTVHGSGVARGTPRTPLLFPDRWRLEAKRAVGGWKLQSILMEERVLARRCIATGNLTEDAILACAGDADLERFLAQLSDELSIRPTVPPLEAVRSIARAAGLPVAEMLAVRGEVLEALANGRDRLPALTADARAIADASGNADARAIAILFSGTSEWQLGRYDDASRRYATADALLDAVDDPRPVMKALYMRGALALLRGMFREALLTTGELEEITKRFDWTEGRCLMAIQRSAVFTDIYDPQLELHYAAEAYRCAQRLGKEEFLVLGLSNLAQGERDAGNHEAAALLREKILARTASGRDSEVALALARYELVQDLAQAGHYAEAEAELARTLPLAQQNDEHHFEADLLQMMARIHLLQGRTAEALRDVEAADTIIRTQSDTARLYRADPSWVVRATLGRVLSAMGRTAEATAALQSSIDLIESVRAEVGSDELALSGFMRNKEEPYRHLVALLVAQGKAHDALVVSERFRARALGNAVARGHVDRLPSMTDADRKHLQEVNAAISSLNRRLLASGDDAANAPLREQLADQRREERMFLSRLYAGSPAMRARNLDDPEIVLGDARRLLPMTGEALLTYSVHADDTFVFYAERSGDALDVSVQRIAIRKDVLEERVRAFVRQIESRDLGYRRSAGELYELLVAPFAARIAAKRLLYIVPDGMLWRLPFQALQSPGGEHLVERVAIAYAPSLTLLRHRRDGMKRRNTPRTLLAIADPLLPPAASNPRAAIRGAVLTPLPDARAEVMAIAKMYGRSSRTLVGGQATETAAKSLAAGFPLLHLATHALIDDAAPLYSAIVLGASGSDDGLLEAREMMDLQLGADLAILSACDSASGDLTPGEGMIGMSWALMVAGCRNTVVSQWNVDSASTAQMMIAFHAALRRRGADYPTAMREAQLKLLRNPRFSHPYYWSPFVLIATSQ
jgi:CHAT domain-containing protein